MVIANESAHRKLKVFMHLLEHPFFFRHRIQRIIRVRPARSPLPRAHAVQLFAGREVDLSDARLTTLGTSGCSSPPVCLAGPNQRLTRGDALLVQADCSRRYRSAASLVSACESRPGSHIRSTAQDGAKRDKSRRPGRQAGLGPGKVFVPR